MEGYPERVGCILESGARAGSPFVPQRHWPRFALTAQVVIEAFVWIESRCQTKHPIKATRPISASRVSGTIMSTEQLRVPNGETYREKALRKFKQQPLVPLGSSNSIVKRAHITGFRDRCHGHDVYAADGCEQTTEATVQGHELLATRSRDRAGAHNCCGRGWCLDDGPDETPD